MSKENVLPPPFDQWGGLPQSLALHDIQFSVPNHGLIKGERDLLFPYQGDISHTSLIASPLMIRTRLDEMIKTDKKPDLLIEDRLEDRLNRENIITAYLRDKMVQEVGDVIRGKKPRLDVNPSIEKSLNLFDLEKETGEKFSKWINKFKHPYYIRRWFSAQRVIVEYVLEKYRLDKKSESSLSASS